MGRVYSATTQAVAISAAADLWEILTPGDLCIVLHEIKVTQSSEAGDAQSEQLRTSIRRVTGSPTSGSSGSTPTPTPLNFTDTASSCTVEANNTSQLSGGTNAVLYEECWNVMNGWHYLPTPECRIVFSPAQRLLVELEAAPADAVTISSTIVYEEIGG